MSHKQLSFKIDMLRKKKSIKALIDYEINNGVLPSDAVEDSLSFVRNWAEFIYPKLLRALNRIQAHVFTKLDLKQGDYEYFADAVENLFMFPTITSLEEYGIPHQITLKIADRIKVEDGLDAAIESLLKLPLDDIREISDFEKKILMDFSKPLF